MKETEGIFFIGAMGSRQEEINIQAVGGRIGKYRAVGFSRGRSGGHYY